MNRKQSTQVILKMKKFLIIFFSLVFLALSWNYSGRWRFCSQLQSSAESSDEIILERYGKYPLIDKKKSLAADDFEKWLNELPSKFGSFEYTYTKCWIPHHRIIFKGKTLEVCFNCDEFWLEGSGRRKMPRQWYKPFRELFQDAGLPDTAPSYKEYAKQLDLLIEGESMQEE